MSNVNENLFKDENTSSHLKQMELNGSKAKLNMVDMINKYYQDDIALVNGKYILKDK